MNRNVENAMRTVVAEYLPGAVEKAMKSYNEYLEQYEKQDGAKTDFKKHHETCKVALAHVALLIRLAAWAGEGGPGEPDIDLADLLENARKEGKNHKEYIFNGEND